MIPTYEDKPLGYFDTARTSFIDVLPKNPDARLLDIGAGTGDTAAYAMQTGKCGWCCGVELCEEPARIARGKLQQVIVGDVEKIDLDLPDASFDILILSEVLEHLVDPWAALRRFRDLLKPGALVVAGSPNVCDRSVLFAILSGQWYYESKGIFDATHLRWFSPSSYKAMFEDCGFKVDSVGPAFPLRAKARIFNRLTFGYFEYLLHSQIMLRAHRE